MSITLGRKLWTIEEKEWKKNRKWKKIYKTKKNKRIKNRIKGSPQKNCKYEEDKNELEYS